MKQEAIDLLSDRNVQVYFLVLGLAIYHCVKLYYKHSSTARTTGTQSSKVSIISPLLSLTILSTTWYLILRFILANLQTSTSYFDDAYKDVLRDGHYFTSTQLLSWAIVAAIWVEDVTGHTDIWNGVPFLLFGFLGAMGSSFVLWSNITDTADAWGTRKKRVGKRESTVSITYVFTSTIAFISILKLQPCDPTIEECTPEEGFGTFHPYFRQWLQCLHIFLLAPILISLALPKEIRVPRIPSTLLFGVLAAVCTCWQIHQIKNGARFIIPMTDCQLSITADLVCCSCITLYAIYTNAVKVGKRDRLSDEVTVHYALQRMCLSAILMPLVSPAAVLAGHLCLNRFGETYSSYISWVQQQVAFKLSNDAKIKWCNLGLWLTNDCDYNQACTNLAHALGKLADLNCHDAVLSCGCGSIDEVRFFKHEFKLKHATGIDPHLTEARMTDKDDYNVRAIRASVDDLAERDSDDVLFPPRLFNKIVALDNIYHYRRKEWFLRDCIEILPAGGVVAVSDIVLKQHSSSTPLWIKALLRLMGVETNGLWSIKEYKQELARKGFDSDVNIELIGRDVYKGWSCLPKCLLQYLDYALIVAKKPGLKNHPTKKRIAIIGSGLAGLSTAHYLLSSQDAAEYDVDIYEANTDSPGLAGNTHLIGDQLVDIPARMACLGYYNEYKKILDDLDIPSTIVRTDSSFYGDDGNGMHVYYSYDQRSLVNIYNAIFVGGIRNLLKMLKALNILDKVQTESQDLSFGEWLKINLGLPETKTYRCEMTGRVKQHDLPSLICHNNPFIYVMVGALSWMLSCTWEALLKYPADIVLPYCRGLKMSRLGSGREGQVIRIVPSIKVLERTLLYGVSNLYLGSRVTELDSSKCINGTSYDAVVIATEAKAVEKVTKNASSVFGKIEYHPSTIYLHTDDSFMPQDKKHWRCWNVDMSSGRPEPQLTFWLNEFYPDSHFDSNVFQTWAPSHQPKEGTIIKRSDFERVVHSTDTRSYIDIINSIQGKDGFYFAGSYCEYGMGLLEEALKSGKSASNKILHDLSIANRSQPQPTLNALVVGAGPSGLVAAKYLLESEDPLYNVTVLEQSHSIGGTFVNKVYDGCRLVSSKYLTAFSDYRMSEDTDLLPDHPSAESYVEYLESYAKEFGLNEHIHFGCQVVSLKCMGDQTSKGSDVEGYRVQYKTTDGKTVSMHFDVVAVCSGLHNVPHVPKLFENGEFASKFKGDVFHSTKYQDASVFDNKRVLILGSGETAMDLAHRAVLNPSCKSVGLSVRNGLLSIPHNLARDRPLDVFITNLFESAYEHPWVHALRLRWLLSTTLIRIFLFLTGSSNGFNQWAVPTTPVRRGYHIINKSHAAMSHLNVPIKKRSVWGRLWLWLFNEQDLRPIESFHLTEVDGINDDGVTVRFKDGRTYQADVIVLATGYKQSFPFLDEAIQEEFRRESICSNNLGIDEDCLPCEHFIVGRSRPRLGFIGFVRPNVGAIPPMSELQVMWWLQKMRGRVHMLKRNGPVSYMVLGKKYQYGVDYGNYMHRVAEDIGAAPTLSMLASSSSPFKALYTYCIGQSMVSLFRLQGPYESAKCWNVVLGELWRVCIRRGWVENLGLLFVTWLSLLINICACILELVWCILTLKRPQFFVRY